MHLNKKEHHPFTLVSTVFNEARRLQQTILDLENQVIKPNEIIITDAGSKDGTYDMLLEWSRKSSTKIIILQKDKCNVAEGRNLAISKAKNDIIVSTDFGCRFSPQWTQSLVEPFENPAIEVVGGAFKVKEDEIVTLAAKSDYILQNGYKQESTDFPVSSRSIAYRKYVWEKIGGYPEWLTLAADDLVFWLLIKKYQFNLFLNPEPHVFWGRHAKNKGFAKEAFRYGLGDGESRVNYRNFLSNCMETGFRYLIFAILIISPILFLFDLDILLLLLVPFSIGLRSYKNAFIRWNRFRSNKYNWKVLINSLWQIELSRIHYIKGYLKGLTDKDPKKEAGRQALWTKLKS